ncbi:hypothetical protein A3C23_04980 [Candidatus Roizmanbacteria bacterium RIFCSPHIGHO2_02_FULL_37_13b]|uniref:Uncharacterized protein n=1 Tax=Candidatus Roizmanbacteria bacterium RIFCSPLOWO2_02_FULL_36_11 TaxID=1802071 RepID=A0A1F7JIP0_9BACT|nr:MAG: hypothetical protein A3C23_04980 [Candidatus Roizmanbacteria bacterium RIFCSPHIGHO2_02_FULL_37_13b]OGK55451.1 MAG: hypothetical protein A3H78_01165 [Candidatus Roizmanbacteria bacterium RIFCSPLOWO2_02_FULL_36_11]
MGPETARFDYLFSTGEQVKNPYQAANLLAERLPQVVNVRFPLLPAILALSELDAFHEGPIPEEFKRNLLAYYITRWQDLDQEKVIPVLYAKSSTRADFNAVTGKINLIARPVSPDDLKLRNNFLFITLGTEYYDRLFESAGVQDKAVLDFQKETFEKGCQVIYESRGEQRAEHPIAFSYLRVQALAQSDINISARNLFAIGLPDDEIYWHLRQRDDYEELEDHRDQMFVVESRQSQLAEAKQILKDRPRRRLSPTRLEISASPEMAMARQLYSQGITRGEIFERTGVVMEELESYITPQEKLQRIEEMRIAVLSLRDEGMTDEAVVHFVYDHDLSRAAISEATGIGPNRIETILRAYRAERTESLASNFNVLSAEIEDITEIQDQLLIHGFSRTELHHYQPFYERMLSHVGELLQSGVSQVEVGRNLHLSGRQMDIFVTELRGRDVLPKVAAREVLAPEQIAGYADLIAPLLDEGKSVEEIVAATHLRPWLVEEVKRALLSSGRIKSRRYGERPENIQRARQIKGCPVDDFDTMRPLLTGISYFFYKHHPDILMSLKEAVEAEGRQYEGYKQYYGSRFRESMIPHAQISHTEKAKGVKTTSVVIAIPRQYQTEGVIKRWLQQVPVPSRGGDFKNTFPSRRRK